MAYKNLHAVVEAFRAYIFQRRWSVLAERALQNGMQLVVTDNKTRITVDCYTNGNALIQGLPSILKTDLQAWWLQQKAQISSPMLLEDEIPLTARSNVDAFREFALSNRWIMAGKKMHNGIYQLRIISSDAAIPVMFYPTGAVSVQGNAGPLKQTLQTWWMHYRSEQPAALWQMAEEP
jgi:hypothetical protein